MWYDKNGAGAYMVERIEVAGSTLFILDIILWVTTLIALILAFLKKNFNKIILILMIFASIILIAIGIAFLYYMWGIAALSGVCNMLKEINKGNSSIFEDMNVQ